MKLPHLVASVTALAVTSLVVPARPALAAAAADLEQRIAEHLELARDDLVETRRDLHRHPELSGREERTAGIVARRLSALGLEVATGVGGHGVIGVLRGGKPGPVVAFRADIDAARSSAPDPVAFASVNPGVRHVCGHDIHTTVGLALAEGLAVCAPSSLEPSSSSSSRRRRPPAGHAP